MSAQIEHASAVPARAGVGRRDFLRYSGGMALLGLTGAPILGGCSSDGGGGNSKELTFWNFYGPDPKANPRSKWFTDMVAAWNKNNDVKVKLRYIPNAEYISGNTLQTAFSSGNGPDIFLISPGDFLRYYNGKVCVDLSSHIPSDVRSDYIPGVLDTRMVDDKIFALPMEVEPLAMYYNTQHFEQAGISEPPKTWDQFLTAAQKLTSGKRFGALFETGPGYYQNFTWYPFMWQGGGNAVAPDNKRSAFDSDAVVKALAFWQETQKRKVSPKKALGTGAGDIPANLASGYCSMQQSGIWSVADLTQQKAKFPYGVMPLPIPEGGKAVTDGGGWAFAANAKGANPDAAATFIAWALGSSDAACIERGRQWNTVAKTNLPTRTTVQKSAEAHGAFQTGAMKTFADEIVPSLRSEPRYPPEVYKAISDAIQNAQLSGGDPKAAAQKAGAAIDTFLQGYDGAPIL